MQRVSDERLAGRIGKWLGDYLYPPDCVIAFDAEAA